MRVRQVLEVSWWWGSTLLDVHRHDGVHVLAVEETRRAPRVRRLGGHAAALEVPRDAWVVASCGAGELRPGDRAAVAWHGTRLVVRWVEAADGFR